MSPCRRSVQAARDVRQSLPRCGRPWSPSGSASRARQISCSPPRGGAPPFGARPPEAPAGDPDDATGPAQATPPAEVAPVSGLVVRSAEEYFETLERRFVPGAASGVDAVFQWELGGEGGGVFHAHVRDGRLEVQRGAHAQPTVSLVLPAADYVRVVNGELDGTRAFTVGGGKVKGSIAAAMKMRSLFPARGAG